MLNGEQQQRNWVVKKYLKFYVVLSILSARASGVNSPSLYVEWQCSSTRIVSAAGEIVPDEGFTCKPHYAFKAFLSF